MPTTEQELKEFAHFVQQRLAQGEANLSLDELFDLWRQEHPSNELYAENVAAIAASMEDLKRGERGTIAGEHSARLRREFGFETQ